MKLAKATVGFEHPACGPHHCGGCAHFEAATGTCEIVAGRIASGDWCRKWRRRAMAKLTYGERERLPRSSFALPATRRGGKGGYPIPDKEHARAALARVSQHGTAAQKSTVRAKVRRKFPGMKLRPLSALLRAR